jgi:hypothetical protein
MRAIFVDFGGPLELRATLRGWEWTSGSGVEGNIPISATVEGAINAAVEHGGVVVVFRNETDDDTVLSVASAVSDAIESIDAKRFGGS